MPCFEIYPFFFFNYDGDKVKFFGRATFLKETTLDLTVRITEAAVENEFEELGSARILPSS